MNAVVHGGVEEQQRWCPFRFRLVRPAGLDDHSTARK